METVFWTNIVPVVTVLGGLGAMARQFLFRPYMAARAEREAAERLRVDQLAAEMAETRREMHLLCRALFSLRERIDAMAEGGRS